jgi:hypothetical protein
MDSGGLGWWGVLLAVVGGAIRVSTPFLFVSLVECITEKLGVGLPLRLWRRSRHGRHETLFKSRESQGEAKTEACREADGQASR